MMLYISTGCMKKKPFYEKNILGQVMGAAPTHNLQAPLEQRPQHGGSKIRGNRHQEFLPGNAT